MHKLRDTTAGVFHIFTHCVWATPHLYRDDVDRMAFLRLLARVSERPGWTCVSYCLMTSHYHLIVQVEDGVLPPAMQALNHPYARGYNKKYGLRGHVQFRRYGSRRIEGDGDFLRTYKYVANNPVEAGLCSVASQWPWSSFAGTVGLVEATSFVDPSLVLRCFNWPAVDPRAALRAEVEEL
ncbi:MAG TPA: transposase [Gaiellaceae bacterium]|jgi:REP element-mobilizing transposase RayT